MEDIKPLSLSPTAGRETWSDRMEVLRDFLRRLWASPSARVGGVIVLFTIGLSAGVTIFDNYDASRDSSLPDRYAVPDCIIGYVRSHLSDTEPDMALGDMSCKLPFGADKIGRDIMRRVGHGMSVLLRAGLIAVTLSLSLGTITGLTGGYMGGWIDSLLMRIMDVILAFPSLLLAVAIVTVAGPSLENGMIAVAITQIPVFARLARSMAISIRNTEYVIAAQSVGAGHGGILWRHVLPNSLAPLIVQTTLGLGTAVVETAALGFLGLGQQPPFPELGKMLAESQQSLASGKWWVMVFPGAAIVLIVLGFNLLGDGLRDVLDPRLKK